VGRYTNDIPTASSKKTAETSTNHFPRIAHFFLVIVENNTPIKKK
jgi:hypothetical protein